MDFAYYSIALITAFAFARYVTENTKIHLKFKGFWVHHWILAALAMIVVWIWQVERVVCLGCPYWCSTRGIAEKELVYQAKSLRKTLNAKFSKYLT